ncbi:MAG: alpha-L-rhamnosidase C-terminal domain-containing protein, partial [Alloprevotella sp.]
GYRHFRIDPQYAEKLTWTRVTKETPYGTISVDWKKENGKTTLNVAIPVGTTATTQLPKHASSCTVDGTPVGGQEIVLTAGIHHIVAQ